MQTLAHYITHKLQILQKQFDAIALTSVYIGGGTPSIVEEKYYEKVFASFSPFLKKDAEISIEANPNSLSLAWLNTLKDLGVNRLSLGVQSFDAKKLEFLEREHHLNNTFKAIETALKANIKHLSIDLIYNTPLCTKTLLLNELKIACSLPITHISAYELSIDVGSRFYKLYKHTQKDSNAEFHGFSSMGHFVAKYLDKFKQYEVSNYGEISTHNLGYWQGKNYIGIGAGAYGCVQNIRTFMPQNLEDFLQDFKEHKEILNPKDIELEHLFLGFRSCVGVEEKNISNKKNLEILQKERKIYKKGTRVFAYDYFLGDALALFLS